MKDGGPKAEAVWSDFSQRWFTLMHSTRPFNFRDYQEIADHVRPQQYSVFTFTIQISDTKYIEY